MTNQVDDPLAHARALTRLLDGAAGIPGTRIRIGLDPIIGLVPGLGDAAGAALGGYLVLLGARLGAPGSVIARMLLNVAVDAAVGALPVVGDVFDFVWKANSKNLALLERYLEKPISTRKASRVVLAATGLAVAGLGVGAVVLAFVLVKALASLI